MDEKYYKKSSEMAAISEHWNFLFLSKSKKFVLAAANDESERQKMIYFLVVEF